MNNELFHYGIKGMHWGIRRFQNPDGSYTTAGRARYNVGGYRGTKKSKQVKGTGSKLRTGKLIADDSANLSRQSANMLRKSAAKSRNKMRKQTDLSRMSDQELRDWVNRGNLERQYRQLYESPQTTSGREHVADFLDNLGDAIQFAGTAAGLALIIYGAKHGKIG